MSSNFDRFKKLKPGGELDKPKISNPYTKPTTQTKTFEEPKAKIPEDSILGGPNKSLHQQLYIQAKEIKELKEDLASLYSMLMGDGEDEVSEQEVRERYMVFKTDRRHLINRKRKKINE
jgi:hypothetical protein